MGKCRPLSEAARGRRLTASDFMGSTAAVICGRYRRALRDSACPVSTVGRARATVSSPDKK
jgi:hypothetical protein